MIRIAFCQTNHQFILLERAEKEIRFSMANGMFKMKMDNDRHGPRLMLNNCKNLNPLYFSLPSTFNLRMLWPQKNPRRIICLFILLLIHNKALTRINSLQCWELELLSEDTEEWNCLFLTLLTFLYYEYLLRNLFPVWLAFLPSWVVMYTDES